MNELELIQTYAPVLKFAKVENFFPMKVEGYVRQCFLEREGEDKPRGIPYKLALKDLPTGDDSHRYLLRFANWTADDLEEYRRLYQWLEEEQEKKALIDFQEILWDVFKFAKEAGIDVQGIFRKYGIQEGEEVCNRAKERYKRAKELLGEKVGERYSGIDDIDHPPPVYYYRIVEDEDNGYTVVQYWLFYAYNDFGTTHGGVNDHEADWESIHLFFEGDKSKFLGGKKPAWAAYSAHVSRDVHRWDPGEMEFEGDHPVAYVGAGSHGSYYRLRDASEKEIVADDVVVGGAKGIPWDEPEPITDQPWFAKFKGLWGSWDWRNRDFISKPIDKFAGGSPAGPKFNPNGSMRKKWKDPVGWAGIPPLK
jgi:hypothetical protein